MATTLTARISTSTTLRRAMDSLLFADANMIELARARIADMLHHGDDRTAVRAINAMWLGEKMLLELAGEETASASIEATLDSIGDISQRDEVYRLMSTLTGGMKPTIGDNLPQTSPVDPMVIDAETDAPPTGD